jgi:hypothetical protein
VLAIRLLLLVESWLVTANTHQLLGELSTVVRLPAPFLQLLLPPLLLLTGPVLLLLLLLLVLPYLALLASTPGRQLPQLVNKLVAGLEGPPPCCSATVTPGPLLC